MSTVSDNKPNRTPLFIAAGGIAVAIVLDVALSGGSGASDAMSFFGRFHPLAVHMPIGMILLLAALEGLCVWPKLRARIDPAVSTVLRLALLSALAAFTMGLLLAHGGGYPAKLLRLHKLLTLATVIGAAGSVFAWSVVETGANRLFYRGALMATVTLLSIGAHLGGSMTHGDNYLVQYAPAFMKGLVGSTDTASQDVAPPPAAPVSDPRVFADVVMPVLKEKCIECHGPEKSKAGLRMDSLEAMLKGGDDGPAFVAGHSEKSLLVTRAKKPTSEDEHMPPADKPQLTAEELDLLSFWIDRGGSADQKVRDVLVPDGARGLLIKASAGIKTAPTPPPPVTTGTTSHADKPKPTAAMTSTTTAAMTSTTTTADAPAYAALVAPLLANKCGRCHGADKQKGKLRTDSLAALLVGGKSGPAIVANDTAQWTLMKRAHLPMGDDKHMPPSDEPQLTTSELALLSFWIGHGADATLATTAVPANLRHISFIARTHEPATLDIPMSPEVTTTAVPTSTASGPPSSVHPVKLFTDVVAPIFKNRCGDCHSGEFASGDFIIGDHAQLFAKSRVVPGDTKSSTLFGHIISPLTDDEHMPPKKRQQPTPEEIDAVRLWIARGATEDVIVDASEVDPRLIGATVAPSTTASKREDGTPPQAAKLAVVPPRAAGCGCELSSESSNATLAATTLPLFAMLARRRRKRSNHYS